MRKKIISLFMAICMTVMLIPSSVLPVLAQTTQAEDWNGSQTTGNLIPTMNEGDTLTAVGWGNIGDQIRLTAYEIDDGDYTNKIGIQARNTSHDIGNKDYTGGVYWQIDFSDEDKVKINKGDIFLSASARYWIQASSDGYLSLRFEFFNAQNILLDDSHKKTYTNYWVGQHDTFLELNNIQIPQNTAYVRIWFSNWGSLSGRPFIGDMSAYLTDATAPLLVDAPYEYSVNGSSVKPLYTVPGDRVTYAMKFDEAVTVSAFPTMDLSIGNGVSYDTTYSADRQTVYFTTTLANTGANDELRLKNISGLSVKDDAGNVLNYTNSGLSAGTLSYKSVFGVTDNLTNLSFSGASTVCYGNAYTATLIPAVGYKLPESITVKVNGGVITDYVYNQSNGQIDINVSAIVGDIEIIAVGAPQTYTITFDMQGGSGGTESIAATYTQGLSPVTPPTKAGYTFGGYYTAANGAGVQYYSYDGNSAKTYDKTSDMTLYAKWSAKSYTVTLDAAGGTGSGTITAVYDANMPSITKPTKAGHTFGGYFTQQNGGGEKYYNADGTSAKQYDKTDGLMLYAKWSANSYTVTFDMQGGIGGTASESATYDLAMPSITPPTRIGYTFGGYYTGANGAGTQYYYVNGESAKAYDIDGACTLYAKWTANTYDVVLNASGGSGGSTVTAAYDSDMPVIAAPDKPGYLFSGYFDEKNGRGTKYYNADCSSAKTYDKAEGITLYALWTPITYNIQLYSRGEYVGALNDVTYGELRLPSAESLGISFANHNFVGWNIYDEQNWAMYTADSNYSAGLVTEQGKTAYIYAAWLEKDKYTVTYDANGGGGAPAAVEVHVDETITLSDIVPSRENYTFVGWSENSESASAQYQPNDSFTMGNSLVTLFAVWNKNPELTYNANGGTFSTYAGVSYPASGSTVTLTGAVPQKDGYIFRGWAESETAAVDEIISSPYIMPNHDTVLYAVYEPIKYAVSVNTADGYSVSGIAAGGYTLGEYAEFTVSGANPKVYINGILSLPIGGTYKFEVKNNSAVVVCSDSSVNVVYNANSGINAPVDMHIYTNGDAAVIASGVPARTGYTFSGWAKTQDADSAEYTGGESIPVAAEDIILYAVWEPITYTIKYAANGGSGAMSATAAVYDERVTLSENTFTKSGCQFVGWSYAADGELSYANGVSVKNLTDTQNDEITLYAVWKGAETTVRFRFEGGSSGTAFCEAVYGELLPTDKLTAPNRYGYIFEGFYTAPNKGGNLVYNADMSLSEYYRTHTWDSVLSEFDLYAAWEPVNYTVAFVNGTETLADTVGAVYGQSFRLPRVEILDISVPQGYSFMGWSVASGSDTVYYSDGQEITTGLTGENGGTVYLYAVIQKNVSYTVTLPASGDGYKVYYNGNELTSQTDIKVNQNEDISFSISVEDGYSSDKMTVLANGIMLGATQISGRTYNYNIKNVSADTSVNIYHVKKDAFRIILNNGTGYSVSPKNAVVESGDDFTFTVTLSDGYKTASPVVFVNGQELSGVKNEDVFTYTVSDITAQPVISVSVVSKPQYTVTFISNGSIYSISTVEENAKASQPSVPERYGYTFGGWYTDRNFTSLYDFQAEITNAVTLYAKWTADTYAVEYNKNTTEDVSVPNEQTKEHDTVLILSSVIPSRTGYTFAGWNTRPDGSGTSYGAGSELSVNSNITLYAQWKINRYTVTLITGEGVTGNLSANEAAYNETVTVIALSGNGYNSPVITAVPRENAELVSEGIYRITGPVSFVAVAKTKTIYTASFYLDGGLYYTQSAIEGSLTTVALPNPPGKHGYSFTGWYTEQTGGTEVDEETVLDRNMSVYARFEANTLNVTPAQSETGYTVTSGNSTTVNYGGDYTFTVTIAEHYNADNMRVYANGILLIGSINGNTYTYMLKNISENQIITVTGVELDKHTVTYMVDGQIYSTAQKDYNTLLAEPASPSKAGKTFKGWSDGNHIWSFAQDKVTEDITLKAVWDSDVFTVTPAQSGTGYTVDSTDSTTVNYGDNYTFTVTISEHYNANAMKVYANGVLLTGNVSGNVYSYTVKNITADTVITVEDVKADVYTVKYIVDGENYHSENVKYSGNAQKPKAPVKAGYTFDGWYVGSKEWDFANEIESDLELVAKFTPLTYRLTVPDNQSEFTVNVTSANPVEYGGSFTFDIIASEGYNVSDMMVYANGVLLEKDSENGNSVSFSITNITEAKVITVRGIGQNTYAVTYRANTTDYVGNMPENAIKAYDNNIAVSDLVPERYGYDFIGWSTAENGTAQYHAGDIYSENSDLTLYAVWKAKTFTVSFETSGGNINSGEITEYTYGTGTVLPTDVTKEGYDFAGWYEDELLQGARVYEIKASDYGNKKYYAAYSIADVTVNGYLGEYDGNAHNITYALTDNLSVEKYQWYFVPEGASNATAVQSDSYNSYAVTDVADSGEYYCYIEALIDEYVIRFFTERATVKITKKPVSVKASDSSKGYDAQPLAENGIELTDGSSLADNHTISAVMTADSTITKVGTQTNVIDLVTILDISGKNVTENYEITKQNGTLSVTPLTLTVTAENTSVSAGSALNENRLYKISGMLGDEKLSLANASVTAKNANGEEIAFADITKNAGAYTVIISYSGFDGEGSENYRGSGTITSEVTVYKRSSGGSSGGGSTSTAYTVKFDTDEGSKIASQTVKVNGTASEPETPEKEGYIFDGWYTDKELITAYDFAAKVTKSFTLYARWTEKVPDKPTQPVEPTTPEWKNPFTDVKEDDWYYEDVEYAVENGFMRGTSNTTFAPDGIITRAMMVTVLYRAEGEPEIKGTTTFEDVDTGAYYANAVVWAQQNGIIKGYSETEFAPDQNITREQIAAIMHRYAQYKGYDVSVGENTNILSYTDAESISEYAIAPVQYAVGSGSMTGKSDSTLNPLDNATRAEIAAILHRFVEANK